MSYSIPALILGLGAAQAAYIIYKPTLESALKVQLTPFLTVWAYVLPAMMATIVPLLSSLIPILRALRVNLNEALSKSRAKTKMVTLTIERSTQGVSSFNAAVGLMLAAFGFGIHYFLPLALLSNNLTLLFNIFLCVLFGMILGLVCIASNFTQALQSALGHVVFLLLYFENNAMKNLVRANLMYHQKRNRKTSLLFSISLSFIIFLTVSSNVEIRSLQYQYRKAIGADFLISSNLFWDTGLPVSIESLSRLEDYAVGSPLITGFAWVTWPLHQIHPKYKSTTVSSYGKINFKSQRVFGVSPSFFDIMPSDTFQASAYDLTTESYSPSEQLYTRKGQFSAVLSSYYQLIYSLKTFVSKIVLNVIQVSGKRQITNYFPITPMFFCKSSPLFNLVNFPKSSQDLLISLPKFLELTNGTLSSVYEIPIRYFFIKLSPSIKSSEYSKIKRELAGLLTYETLRDGQDELKGTKQALSVLNITFESVSGLIMIITFFSLSSSMYVNIAEQTREIGILCALGLSKKGIFRVYFYESFILLIAASIIGVSMIFF
jgi:hypothetical protein